MGKLSGVLQSRKFWSSLLSLLVAVGVLQFGDAAQADLVSAILTIVAGVGFTLGVAIEDAGRGAGGQLRD
jgi:hypothetical protein